MICYTLGLILIVGLLIMYKDLNREPKLKRDPCPYSNPLDRTRWWRDKMRGE